MRKRYYKRYKKLKCKDTYNSYNVKKNFNAILNIIQVLIVGVAGTIMSYSSLVITHNNNKILQFFREQELTYQKNADIREEEDRKEKKRLEEFGRIPKLSAVFYTKLNNEEEYKGGTYIFDSNLESYR